MITYTSSRAAIADPRSGKAITGSPSAGRGRALAEVEAGLLDIAVYVGPLIDGVCSRYRDWIDWDYYRPLPRECGALPGEPPLLRLELAQNRTGLRDGGYIEIRISSQNRRVEADGGYYDGNNQPRHVIDGSLAWHEIDYQGLGQLIIIIYDRIVRQYAEQSRSTDGCPG